MNQYGLALSANAGVDQIVDVLAAAAKIARREEDLRLLGHILANTAFILLWHDRYAEVPTFALEALELAPRVDDPSTLIELGHRALSVAFYALGEFQEARPHAEALIEYQLSLPGTGHAHRDYRRYCVTVMAQGQWDEARRIAALRLNDSPSAPEFELDAYIEFMTGSEESAVDELSRLVRDRVATDLEQAIQNVLTLAVAGLMVADSDAIDLAVEAAHRDSDNQHATPSLAERTRQLLGVFAIARGDSDAASVGYSGLLKYRQTWSGDALFMGPDRTLALLAATAGKPKQAALHFDESLAFCKKAGTKPELAWTYHDYVKFRLVQPGRIDRVAANGMIDDGLTITDSLGMAPLQKRLEALRDEVTARGVSPVYPDGLTQREVEVLRLVALGRTNREVAEELVITENTAARHVANILGKTSSANRAEAATYASARGLLETPVEQR